MYQFTEENPKYEYLVPSWNSATDNKNIMVDSIANNSDNVKVVVTIIDNYGNESTNEIYLKICVNKPTLEITYVNDPAEVQTYEDITYYDSNRTAKIVITGRTSVFNASMLPTVEVVETKGDTADKTTWYAEYWQTTEVPGDPDAATHEYLIHFNGSANYEFTVDYADIFGNELDHRSNKFVVDHEKPTASITINDNTTWTKLLETITFGLWKNEKVMVKATADDVTSPIKKFEMYRTDSIDTMTSIQLDELYKDGAFRTYESFVVAEDAKFVVYIRVEDYAGHYDYICSDGFVVDMTDAEIVITPEYTDLSHNGIPLYNDDIDVRIDIAEKKDEAYSGIKEVKYWVTCDGATTQEAILYHFDYDMNDYVAESDDVPTYLDLCDKFTDTITIESAKNNSCNVVFYVSVTDNAGNVKTESVKVDSDITAPTIKVEYNNNASYKIDGERGYYPANRVATITITERTEHFEAIKATAGIKIKAVDANGDPIVVNGVQLEVDNEGYIVDITKLFGTVVWDTVEGATPDEATHTLVLPYNYDANYTFDINYSDLADNANNGINTDAQNTPYEFTVDKVIPTATINVEQQSWSKLLEVLTFGLFSKEDISVSVTSDDVTSLIESVEYYKTDLITPLSADELELITFWTDITADPTLVISDEERVVIYLKVTDYAGNYIYINSDGYVVDKTQADITLTPEHTDRTHNNIPLYKDDVDVLIKVIESKEESDSGIKQVKYWVTCDGIITQEEQVIYYFDYDMNDYVAESNDVPTYRALCHEFSQVVTIEANNNNSCDVVLYVMVTDNAGNVKTESLAVDIDITVPTIEVKFNDNNPRKVVDNKGYFPSKNARIATVVITERTAHFDAAKATDSIKISAVDSTGKVVINDCSALVSNWESDKNTTYTHVATIDFSADANYEFTLSYEDLASNCCKYEEVKFADGTVTPRYFAIDKTAPTGTVTVGQLGTWDKLIEILTFGLWSNYTVDVTGTAGDATSPIESVSYYKTSDTAAKTVDNLNAISNWTAFDKITVPADEKFVVYIRIIDFAGNTTYISTNGIVVDATSPVIEYVKPIITITPEATNSGIYNSDVKVAVSVVEPIVGETNAYAGLKDVRYEVYNMGSKTQFGALYYFDTANPTHGELQQSWNKSDAIIVDKDLNNSNDVKIVVYAVDNAGNSSTAECKISIDITAPTVHVTYDNNDGDTGFNESVYFKSDRTAKIVVTERNFDPTMIKLEIANTDGYIPEIGNWTTAAGTGNGDNTTHTAYVSFSKDGDYTVAISCTDIATNANTEVDYAESLAPTEFTIDKTAPIVNISYDNNAAINGNYYKVQRVATITVTEHNFETGRIKVSLKATDDGVDVTVPTVSNWTSNGDVHTATITYAADALYAFDFDYSDKAGNTAADVAEQTFYVDQTSPALKIENIVDESANNNDGNIGFVMTATDTNFDVFTPVLTAIVRNGDSFETKVLNIGEITDIKNGKVFTVTNIDTDGIYRITCTIVDKAGNAYSEVTLQNSDGGTYVEKRTSENALVTFSVNRDGSTFEIDENTINVVEQYYVQTVEKDVLIVEVNADPLKQYAVTLNGKELEESKDYTVTEEGGVGAWMKYTYKISKDLFIDEGEYQVVVSSKDKADNDAFSDIKAAAINFVVDRTAPVVTVSGISNGGRYQTDKQLVTLIPTDDGGELKTLIVNLVDEDGNVIQEVINLADQALLNELEANGGTITFEIAEGLYQNVQIICTDCSIGNSEATNTYDSTVNNVSVSSSVFMIFWANKPLRWGTIGGVSAATVALATATVIIKKKKRK